VLGKVIFEGRDCASCHNGSLKTDSQLNLFHDVGTITAASGQRRHQTLTGFDTPTLLGAWATAPYFHDGSAATMADVITRPGHGNAQDLTQAEKDQLVAYLMQIDDSEMPMCTSESDASFCARLAKNCGAVTGPDNCGIGRTVSSCGSCTSPQSCGGSGTANVCGCTGESDASFCSRLGKNCGSVTANDNCGTNRTVSSCGSCTSPATCGGGGTANVCGCTAETNAAFCSRLAKNCGSVTANDNCGTSRTVASCGSCTSPATCGGGGTANVCGSPGYTGTPYGGTAFALGATAGTWYQIEGENYDVGGEGISYHDTTATNTLGAFRTGANEGVDVEITQTWKDVSAIVAGEWTKYTVNATAGTYTVQLGVAAAAAKHIHIEVDGVNVTGTNLVVNSTGGATTFLSQTTTVTFPLTAGTHVLTFFYDEGGFSLNWIKLKR
jgi:hypothetical protein